MDAIRALHERVSIPLLESPGPTSEQLDVMFQAALRAPDHGAMRPWRFLVVENEAREALAELFLQAALGEEPELSDLKRQKMLNMPMRAPTLVIAIASTKPGHKVPVVEQQISAGCATQNLLIAAHAQGVGAMWRTGSMAYHPIVLEGLGLSEDEYIVGYIYLGTVVKARKVPVVKMENHVRTWTGN